MRRDVKRPLWLSAMKRGLLNPLSGVLPGWPVSCRTCVSMLGLCARGAETHIPRLCQWGGT